jgi:DNA repair protein Rad10
MDDPFGDLEISLDAADRVSMAAGVQRAPSVAAFRPATAPIAVGGSGGGGSGGDGGGGRALSQRASGGLGVEGDIFGAPLYDVAGKRLPPGATHAPPVPLHAAPPASQSIGGGAGGGGAGVPAAPAAAAGKPKVAASADGMLLVSNRQRGNPVLSFIRHVYWKYADVVPDYVMGKGVCGLFLSLRYHTLHPSYLFKRLMELRADWRVRVLIVQVDMDPPEPVLMDVQRLAILSDFSVVCAASPQVTPRAGGQGGGRGGGSSGRHCCRPPAGGGALPGDVQSVRAQERGRHTGAHQQRVPAAVPG